MAKRRYKIVDGAIVGAGKHVLYDAATIATFSEAARTRLAKLHSNDPDLDWPAAEAILMREGFIPSPACPHTAYELGEQAYARDQHGPDDAFLKLFCRGPVGNSLIPVTEWRRGWTKAHMEATKLPDDFFEDDRSTES